MADELGSIDMVSRALIDTGERAILEQNPETAARMQGAIALRLVELDGVAAELRREHARLMNFRTTGDPDVPGRATGVHADS